jgi:hypothetical protein
MDSRRGSINPIAINNVEAASSDLYPDGHSVVVLPVWWDETVNEPAIRPGEVVIGQASAPF